jgi:ribonuclease R
MLTGAALLDHIRRLPHARGSFKQLIRELGARGADREELQSALSRLISRGDLIEYKAGYYVSAAHTREFASGRLAMHRDGYGFLVPDCRIEGIRGDIYLSPSSASEAMHGDRVLVRITRIDSDGRAEGEILRVLQRAAATVVGTFRLRGGKAGVVPQDDRITGWIEISDGMEAPSAASHDRVGAIQVRTLSRQELDGMIVDVEIFEYPRGGKAGKGRVIEVIGKPGDFGVDVEIVIRKHHLPHRFPPEVLDQSARLEDSIPDDEIASRQDFRALDIVTIDGETARDFDDAVWVERLSNGNFALQVHIADVSHYVRPGTPIDREATLRGTSVYFPDRAVPMLPLELSTGICSLKPNVDRLALSALLEIDHRGDVVSQRFTRGVIRSLERLTYTNVHLLLEGDPAQRERYARISGRLELMRELALILNRKRAKRGSIDFDLPEPLIEFDEWGEMTGVQRAPRNIAHRIIEEFMLAANEAVAGHLETRGVPSLYRIHEPPDPQRVMEFEDIATSFGYSLGLGAMPVKRFPVVERRRDGRKVRKDVLLADERLRITPRHYQDLVARIEGKPEERVLSYLMLRSLRQARYSADNSGHFALAAPTYTHFTSPIRRYPDLVVHRILSALLESRTPPAMDLSRLGDDCSFTERRAAEAERELVEWKKLDFMSKRMGDEFEALIISTTKYGFFVELAGLFVEGLVPLETLEGDRYLFHQNARKIIGERSRRAFAIGDTVRVRLDRIDPVARKLQFSVAEAAPVSRRRGAGRK